MKIYSQEIQFSKTFRICFFRSFSNCFLKKIEEPILVKRKREYDEEPPLKRQALTPLKLTDSLETSKREISEILDKYINNQFEDEIDTTNEYFLASNSLLEEIKKREKVLRTRHTILCATNKDLKISESALSVLQQPSQDHSK